MTQQYDPLLKGLHWSLKFAFTQDATSVLQDGWSTAGCGATILCSGCDHAPCCAKRDAARVHNELRERLRGICKVGHAPQVPEPCSRRGTETSRISQQFSLAMVADVVGILVQAAKHGCQREVVCPNGALRCWE